MRYHPRRGGGEMKRRRRWLLGGLGQVVLIGGCALLAPGCFEPHLREGGLVCGPGDSCPDG